MIKSVKNIESTPLTAGVGASMQMLISPNEAPHFAMRKFVIKKGGSMPLHTNSVEHEQYVLAGSAKVFIGEHEMMVHKDDVLFIPAGIAHAYDVLGDEDYEFLCLVPNQDDKIEMVKNSCGCSC
ncbi:MAG: cupin domain-containing protein [Sulfurospirillaceae bacterium]|nr:cupin domain-containing protein [Sulfurospirillaceae bacterium]MDD2826016.1 cupin domain-containing protein [Sulfurospirillaceae bacterium]